LGLLGGLTRFCRCCSRLSLGGGPSARWDRRGGLTRRLNCLAGLRGCRLTRSGLCRLSGFCGRLRACRRLLSCLGRRCLRRLLRYGRRLSVRPVLPFGCRLRRVLGLCCALGLLLRPRGSGRRGAGRHGLGEKRKAGLIPGIRVVRTGARGS